MDTEKLTVLAFNATEHTNAMVSYWDRNLVCHFANSELAEWFGRKKEEIIDKINLEELLGTSLFKKNLDFIKGVLDGAAQTFQRELISPSGKTRHVFTKYSPDVIDGEVVGFYVFVGDITPMKLIEKELIEAKERIEEQNKRLLNFSNIVSHNLKNYARGFSGMMELLNEPNSPEEQAEIIEILSKTSNNFTNTINNLTEFVQVENMSNIEPTPIDLYKELLKAISTLNMKIRDSHATIKNNVDQDTSVQSNPAYIESILVNLLSNAIKYKHPDRDPVIELNCYTKEEEVVLTVADNGIGINLEKHGEELFGMYKTFHGNEDANGIGLYTTKYQIEIMGGHIEVESQEGQGCKFIIYFKK